MYNIMNNSITGMSANQGKIDIISNNIANSQTRFRFSRFIYRYFI